MASQLSGLQKWKKWLNSASEKTNVKFKERRDPSFYFLLWARHHKRINHKLLIPVRLKYIPSFFYWNMTPRRSVVGVTDKL